MNRFRMNIEVKGCSKAYDEDEWFLVEIGGVFFMVYDVDEVCVLRAFGHLYSCSDNACKVARKAKQTREKQMIFCMLYIFCILYILIPTVFIWNISGSLMQEAFSMKL